MNKPDLIILNFNYFCITIIFNLLLVVIKLAINKVCKKNSID